MGNDETGRRQGGDEGDGVEGRLVVIHMTPALVCASAEYIAWCVGLPADAQQLFLNFTPQPQRFAFLTSVRSLHAAARSFRRECAPCMLQVARRPPHCMLHVAFRPALPSSEYHVRCSARRTPQRLSPLATLGAAADADARSPR